MTQPHFDLSIVAIIPLYNGAQWIEQCIKSVLAQTLAPDEFIVVDDGSTDGGAGAAIVERLAREHPIITLLHKPNGGQSSARNFAVRHSTSALIALLDQDDIWYSTHLEEVVEPFKKPNGLPIGWVYSDFDDIDADGKLVNRSFIDRSRLENPKRHLATLLGQGAIIQPSATLISRAAFEAVGGFDERMCGYEDDDLFLRIFRENFDNVFIERSTSQWRIHQSSCGASDRNDESLRYYIGKLLRSYPDDKWRGNYYARDVIAPRFINIWLQMYIRAGRYKNRTKMNEYIDDAMALVPLLGLRRRIFYSIALPLMRAPAMGQAIIAARPVLHRVYRAIFA